MKVCRIISSIFLGLVIASGANSENIDLCDKALKAGISVYWDPLTDAGLLEKNGHSISFRTGDAFVLEDYDVVVNEEAPKLVDGKLVSSNAFFNRADNFFKTENSDSPYKIGAILIDPGHGGKDPGTSKEHMYNGREVSVVEKNINLAVGKKVYYFLKKAYPDKQILLTRDKDVFLSLNQRTEIANSVKLKNNEAILYVSIHVNGSNDERASGYEVWYLSPGFRRQVLTTNAKSQEEKSLYQIMNSMMEEEYTTESILIAKFILNSISEQVGKQSVNRGIKEEEWYVCRNSNMPSVLIELGFCSNKKEGLLLLDDRYLQKLSLGIYNGLQAFVTHFEQSRGFTGKK